MTTRHDFDKPFDNVKDLKKHINADYGTDVFEEDNTLIVRWKDSDVLVPHLVFYTLGYTEYWAYAYDADNKFLTLWITSPNVKK